MATSKSSSPTWCFLALSCWNLMCAIDATALSITLPTIAEELKADTVLTYWAGTSFVLGSAIFQPLFASLSHVSERYTVMGALSFFTAGSLIAALATNIETLIGGRTVQGVGAGGLIVSTYIILTRLFDLEQRSKYLSLVAVIWTVGTITGPLIGGGFALVSWRWIFYINFPFAALSFVLIFKFLRLQHNSDAPLMARLLMIDWIGNVLFAASITLILVAITCGGTVFAWGSVGTLLPLILGIAAAPVWALYSYRTSRTPPMIPLVVLNDRTAAISYLGTFIHGIAQFALLYYLPLYYQGIKGYTTIVTGLALLPQCLVSGPATAITGIMIAKTHLTKIFNIIGWLIFTYGLLELTLLDANTQVYDWIVLNIPSGLGIGILWSSLALATQASAESRTTCSIAERQRVKAMASALTPFFRSLGQACGIAIGQAAFTNQIASRLGRSAAKDAVVAIDQLNHGEGSRTMDAHGAVNAFMHGLRGVWWVVLALLTFMFLASFLTRDFSLNTSAGDSGPAEDAINEPPVTIVSVDERSLSEPEKTV